MKRTFVGFGFGPIQAGLFLYEAYRSGNFDRLVVAEIKPETIAALRRDGGTYRVNIATRTGLETHAVTGVEVFHPQDDRAALLAAIGEASEICTALPSVEFYGPVAQLLAEGLRQKCVVYTAENNNHAAEILEAKVGKRDHVQFLNTVIGKMSGVADGAFLVEEFNRILISKITLPGFQRGITVFEEKTDLLPFEEAKLFGHNATHALLGFLAHAKSYRFMSDVDVSLRAIGRAAFLEESGRALIAKHAGVDSLFTPAGWQAYADDLLERMMNSFLRDAVERVIRDPRRKLGWNDRLVGTMRLALEAGIEPRRFATGAAAALALVPGVTLDELWPEGTEPAKRKLKELILHER
jgi:mannitol-1-phosphate 5-dehydrogenase